MDQRQFELATRLLARANPPPVLYRYRKAHDWTLAEISESKIHLTAPDDQNDPFESRAPVVWDAKSLRRSYIDGYAAKMGLSQSDVERDFDESFNSQSLIDLQANFEEKRKDSGMVCLSAVPDSIRMWSYYSQAHEGGCLGFDTSKSPFFAALTVNYQNPEKPIDIVSVASEDPTKLAELITCRKAAEWDFEQEYRIMISPIGNYPRLLPFDPSALIEIRLGAKIKDDFRQKMLIGVKKLPQKPKVIQMKCDFERFVLTEELLPD